MKFTKANELSLTKYFTLIMTVLAFERLNISIWNEKFYSFINYP